MPDSETHAGPPALDFEELTDAFRGCRRSELVGHVVRSAAVLDPTTLHSRDVTLAQQVIDPDDLLPAQE
jgi:hypothetical protein